MDLKTRLELLEASLKEGKKIAIYVAENEMVALFRYQCTNVLDATRYSKKWQAIWFLKGELLNLEKYLDKIDLAIILRQTAKSKTILDFIKAMQKKRIEVLFCVDDLVFDYRDLRVLTSSIDDRNDLYWLGYFWGVRRIAKRVDGFIVTNEFLGEKVKRSFNKPYKVIRNSLNQAQVEAAEECVREKNERRGGEKGDNEMKNMDSKEGFRIGYFSGSPTHVRDLRMVEPEIIEFLKKHDDTELEVVGYMELSERMQEMVKGGRVKLKPLVGYRELMGLMAAVDVNIAPLVMNDFTNCKSELKFFEAGAVETTTIASPTYTFRNAIKDGENGFLAEPGEWYEKLEYLYKHPEKNRQIAKAARKYVLKHYYGKEFLKEVEGTYDYFAK